MKRSRCKKKAGGTRPVNKGKSLVHRYQEVCELRRRVGLAHGSKKSRRGKSLA